MRTQSTSRASEVLGKIINLGNNFAPTSDSYAKEIIIGSIGRTKSKSIEIKYFLVKICTKIVIGTVFI